MSLRHRRLMRLVSIMQHGTMPPYVRAWKWRGQFYGVEALCREGVWWEHHGKISCWNREYREWDRRWKPVQLSDRITDRDRTRAGAVLRRNKRLRASA